MLHILQWTSAVCLQGAGCRSRSSRRALYRDASWAAYVLGLPSSRGGDLELEGGVSVLVKIWRSIWNTYLVWRLNVVNRRYKTFVSTLHYVLENGVDLYV